MTFIENSKDLLKKAFPQSYNKYELKQVKEFECYAEMWEYDDLRQEEVLRSQLRIYETADGYIQCVDMIYGDFVEAKKYE